MWQYPRYGFSSAKEFEGKVVAFWIPSGSLTDEIYDLFEELRGNGYEIRNERAVKSFLLREPGTISCVREAIPWVLNFFGREQKMTLMLVHDPEDENDKGELFLELEISLSPEEALAKLEQLDKEWLVSYVRKYAPKFNITLKFN